MYPFDHGYHLSITLLATSTEVMKVQTVCPKLRNSSPLSQYSRGGRRTPLTTGTIFLLTRHWTEVMNFRDLGMMHCNNALQEKEKKGAMKFIISSLSQFLRRWLMYPSNHWYHLPPFLPTYWTKVTLWWTGPIPYKHKKAVKFIISISFSKALVNLLL